MAESDARQPVRRSGTPGTGWILLAGGDAEGGPYRFRVTPGRERTIGRSTSADFVVQDALVSRFHCLLSVASGELTVENLSRSNGTFVNERRVERTVVLKAGDRLRVGRIVLDVADRDPLDDEAASADESAP